MNKKRKVIELFHPFDEDFDEGMRVRYSIINRNRKVFHCCSLITFARWAKRESNYE